VSALPATTDTAAVDGPAQVTDTSSTEMANSVADTAAAGYVEMARDTSTGADQADTTTPNGDVALQANVDTTAQADTAVSAETSVAVADSANPTTGDTTDNAGRIRPPEDSTEILGQVTTDSTAEAVSPDTTELVRVRPAEDSTEILGNVTTTDEAADETADEQIVNPAGQETVAASETPTDEVGAAAVASDVTGAEAVALMSRAGVRCTIVDPEENEAVRWDMSSTPVTLNPCGMGSMNLSKIWTAGQGDSGTAGQ
jgi:hypothetical protein